MDRRKFLKNSGMVAGGLVGGSLLGGLFISERDDKKVKEEKKSPKEIAYQEARIFFTREEDFNVLSMATERIFPKDHNGPGAIQLGVPYYIDKQLAGDWGINARDYRQGPFPVLSSDDEEPNASGEAAESTIKSPHGEGKNEGKAISEDQSRLNRRELFIEGIRALNGISRKNHDTSFDELEKEQQIDILKSFESGKAKMKGAPSSIFFQLLRQATIEGAYCDPLYGGNKNMDGWKMKEFPGAYPAYTGQIEKDEFFKPDPLPLTNTQQH